MLAHQRAGHTVAVASAATKYQIAPVARDLGVEHLVCTRLVVEDGQFTGATDGPMLWGRHKASGVRAFAREHAARPRRQSYAYGNGYEDVAFLSSVGHPTALNPHRDLRAAAARLGWPALDLSDPVGGSLLAAGRTAAALAGMNAGVGLGLAYGLLARGDLHEGRNAAIRLATHLPMALAGVSMNVLHQERLWTHRPAIFVANHQSSLDIPVLGRPPRARLHDRRQEGGALGPAGLRRVGRHRPRVDRPLRLGVRPRDARRGRRPDPLAARR